MSNIKKNKTKDENKDEFPFIKEALNNAAGSPRRSIMQRGQIIDITTLCEQVIKEPKEINKAIAAIRKHNNTADEIAAMTVDLYKNILTQMLDLLRTNTDLSAQKIITNIIMTDRVIDPDLPECRPNVFKALSQLVYERRGSPKDLVELSRIISAGSSIKYLGYFDVGFCSSDKFVIYLKSVANGFYGALNYTSGISEGRKASEWQALFEWLLEIATQRGSGFCEDIFSKLENEESNLSNAEKCLEFLKDLKDTESEPVVEFFVEAGKWEEYGNEGTDLSF